MPHESEVDDPEQSADEPAFAALLREVAEAPRLPLALMRTITFDAEQGPRPAHLSEVPALPTIGEVVDDRYLIQAELGRGGMGVVFAARNLRTQADVALKWMLPRGLTRTASERHDSVQRFVREARAVSRVDHPNVVRVLDVGGDPATPYLVMERLAGESLRERLTRSVLSWDEALAVMVPVMHGVAAAHRAGVVHRDLKPDNIFLCSDVVKVLDFGVSRIGGDEGYTTLTRTGTILGTPAYMPLEQLRGSRDVDERTDVYALGVILYEALSGRLPFDAQTPADQAVLLATRGPDALADRVPSLRGPRALAVMKALAKDAADRYPSVEAMAAAISSAAQAQPRAPKTLAIGLVLAALAALGAALLTSAGSAPSVSAPLVRERLPDARPRAAPVVEVEATSPPAAASTLAGASTSATTTTSTSASTSSSLRGALGPAPRTRTALRPALAAPPPTVTALSVDQFRAGEPERAATSPALSVVPAPPAPVAPMRHDEF